MTGIGVCAVVKVIMVVVACPVRREALVDKNRVIKVHELQLLRIYQPVLFRGHVPRMCQIDA